MKLNRTLRAGALLAAAVALAAPAARAQGPDGIIPDEDTPPNRQGTRGANFLHLAVGARGNAMGSAVGATTAGPMAWFWNAAGASSSEGFSVAFGRQNLYQSLELVQNYAALSVPVLGGVVGVSLNNLGSGDMLRTTETNPFGNAGGSGQFSWNSTAVGLGYSRRLTDRLAVGGQLKYVSEGITDANTNWTAFDFGTQFNTGIYGLVLAGALQNIGGSGQASGEAITRQINSRDFSQQNTRVNFRTNEVELPTAVRYSIAEDFLGTANSLFGNPGGGQHTLMAEASIFDAVDASAQLGLGAEYGFRDLAFVRAGKRFYNDDRAVTGRKGAFGLSGGLGLRLPVAGRSLRFDYSYTSVGELQNIQVFSFEFGR